MRIEAENLQIAFAKAAEDLGCSVTELDIKVVQHPRGGILGMFRKNAVIEVFKEGEKPKKQRENKKVVAQKQEIAVALDDEKNDEKNFKRKRNRRNKPRNKQQNSDVSKENGEDVNIAPKPESTLKTREPRYQKELIPKVEMSKAIPEIRAGMEALMKSSCFEISDIKVEEFNDETVLIECNGEDAALLIGKEGYRYKAFSYLLYNWINIKYGLGIRLEIAEFLKNQEEMIGQYLIPVIERIKSNGRGQTKPLDGVLIKIALEKLRNEFPEKYVGIKSNRDGGKFIVVNDFNRKNQ